MVGAGTCAEYDWAYGYCSEMVTPLRPTSLYGQCKHAVQSIIQEYASVQGFDFAWGRLFFVYGPGESRQRLVAHLAATLLQDRMADCSAGRQIRDFLHVADAAEAFVALLDSGVTGAVNIASGQPVRLRELIELVARKLGRVGRVRYGALADRPGDPALLVADVRRLADEVGWRARFGLDDGLDQTLEWWREHWGRQQGGGH